MTLNVTIQTRDLAKAVSIVASIVERKHVIAILGHLKLTTQSGNLLITATDSDIEITQTVGAKVITDGEITVAAQTFGEIIKKIPDGEILLEYMPETAQLLISSANCNFKLSTLPAAEFPMMESFDVLHTFEINAGGFATLLDHTKFAISTEETRYNLNGIYLHTDASDLKSLRAAATDCHRLSTSCVALKDNAHTFGVIVPSKAIQEILKITKYGQISERNVKVNIFQNRVEMFFYNVSLKSKVIDGAFPEYKAFIPDTNEHKLCVNAKALAEVVDRVSTITMDKYRTVKIICKDSKIEVDASGAKGVAHETLSSAGSNVVTYSGPEIIIGFNPKYLLDALNTVSDSNITMELHDGSSPVVIRAEKYPDIRFIIMPISV